MQLLDEGLIYDAGAAPLQHRRAAFTGLLQATDGALYASACIASEKNGPNGNIVIFRSDDRGSTWSPINAPFPTTQDGIPGSFGSGYLFQPSQADAGADADDELVLSLIWCDRSNPDLPLANPDTGGLLPFRYYVTRSHDRGATWSELQRVDLLPNKGASGTNEIVQLKSGRWMMSYEAWRDWDETEGIQQAVVRYSDDRGDTWSDPVIMASDPAQETYYWDNRLAVDPKTGRVVTMYWTHRPTSGKDVDIHMQWSDDTGMHWPTPTPTGIAGQIAMPLPLPDGRLLCFYVHRHDPPSMRVVISRDGGRTWRMDDELIVYSSGAGDEAGAAGGRFDTEYWEDMNRWTFGHPRAVLLPDGSVLLAFYAGDANRLDLRWARVGI